ncbi:hypothetical protein AVEN_60213-1 [Araneus ventricosus]|uniref:Uncharacterized protein n=1 Tax=Araneus ventricosus TaxID=182803 RepID=A0A4Y2CM65_ARAVE|nr:hypothetical protein AVEN_60213-1 [Araneus ventricosus]
MRQIWKSDLVELFDICRQNVMDMTSVSQEDEEFLRSQREDRMSSSMSGVDKILTSTWDQEQLSIRQASISFIATSKSLGHDVSEISVSLATFTKLGRSIKVKWQRKCTRIEREFGRTLLWWACRHHTHELILKGVFEECCGHSIKWS